MPNGPDSIEQRIVLIRRKPAEDMTGRELAFIYRHGVLTSAEKRALKFRIDEKKASEAREQEISHINELMSENASVVHELSVEEGGYDGEDLFSEPAGNVPTAREISETGAEVVSQKSKKSTGRKVLDGLVKVVHEPSVVIAVVLLLVMVLFIRPFFVPSGSMRPTLMEGDRILSIAQYLPSGTTYQRGDIACFTAPNGTVYVKRVIGIGGDHIQISGEKVYVNGEESPYQGTGGVMTSMDVQLADDEYWMMGDNRGNSEDSRFIGPVKADKMISKVIAVYLPTEHATFL